MTKENTPKESIEEIVEEVGQCLQVGEYSKAVETLTTFEAQIREEERAILRELTCPCGCDSFIDDADYQETHSVAELESPNPTV